MSHKLQTHLRILWVSDMLRNGCFFFCFFLLEKLVSIGWIYLPCCKSHTACCTFGETDPRQAMIFCSAKWHILSRIKCGMFNLQFSFATYKLMTWGLVLWVGRKALLFFFFYRGGMKENVWELTWTTFLEKKKRHPLTFKSRNDSTLSWDPTECTCSTHGVSESNPLWQKTGQGWMDGWMDISSQTKNGLTSSA